MKPSFISDIKRIQQAKSNNKLTVFVGAGVSNNSGVPTWGHLLDAFKDELDAAIKDEVDSLKVAQYYFNLRGKKEYFEKVKEVLKHGKVSFNPIHDAILDLEPSHIITTNYDDLIEQSLRPRNLQYHIVRKDSDLPYIQTDRLVVKMHGDFETGNIVLTEKDYFDYRVNFPLIDAFVKSLFATKLVLFVGFSFTDYNLRFIVNYIQNLLQEDFQPVYMLVDEPVNHVLKEYYKKKGIYLIEIGSTQLDQLISDCKIDIPHVDKLNEPKGKTLYKQLRLILDYEEDKNLIDYLYDNLRPLENDLIVLNEGLKYFFPKMEKPMWNLHSGGLQVLSPYLKEIARKHKSSIDSFSFLRKNKEKIVFLSEMAYMNNIYGIDDFNVYTASIKRQIKKNQNNKDLYYTCNYKELHIAVKKLSKSKLTYTIKDLELPLILYKAGHFYEAYNKYKELSTVYWHSQKYILYFICVYNQKMLGRLASFEAEMENLKEEENEVKKEAAKINLKKILNSCPFNESINLFFSDIISDLYYLECLEETNDLVLEIADNKKLSDEGGFSTNSNIPLLTSKIYRMMNFGDINKIVCLKNSYNRKSFSNAAAGILIGNSIKEFQGNELIRNSRITEIDRTQLKVILFHNDLKGIQTIFKRYSIDKVTLSKDAKDYISSILDNLLANDQKSIDFIVDKHYFDVFQNIVYILVVSKVSSEKFSSNISTIFLKYKLYNGKNSLLNTDSCSSLFDLLAEFININGIIKDDAVKLLDCIFLRQSSWWKPISLVKELSNSLEKENYILENILDISQINYSSDSDWSYLSALYHILDFKVKSQVLAHLQSLRFSSDYFVLAQMYDKYNIPIFNLEVFERYMTLIVGNELYYTNILLKVRKDERCIIVHDKIDEFINESEFLKFISKPNSYKVIDNIQPEWLMFCAEKEFKKLMKIESLNRKVKNSFDKDWVGKRLKKKFIREA